MYLYFIHVVMVENNNLTYDAWKEYLKNDKEAKTRWNSLVALWESVKKSLAENLESLPYSEALRRRKFLTEKNIFNLINTAKEKPDFKWGQKIIRNAEDARHEYVIQCVDPSSDYIFRKIKEERGVANMHGESIDKYLQPITDKIWALKDTLRVSINPETKDSDLSYESLKTEVSDEVDVDYSKVSEWWSEPVDTRFSWPSSQAGNGVWNAKAWKRRLKNQEIIRDEKWNLTRADGQYLIDFPDFDD